MLQYSDTYKSNFHLKKSIHSSNYLEISKLSIYSLSETLNIKVIMQGIGQNSQLTLKRG